MPGPLFLDGDAVSLHPAVEADVPFLVETANDPRVRATRTSPLPKRADTYRDRLGGMLGRHDETLALLVCVDGERVGFLYLLRENPGDRVHRKAELAYWFAPDHWGNGYATEAADLAVGHAFDGIGLHKVTAKAYESNEASRRVLEKVGFSEEGCFEREAYVDGEWVDYRRYGLLSEDY
ncbi:GNAT family N-acetyltransferase [Halobacterium wangiae]|uniref:GNAT family N-acetyltransferase n=1 Tax=Halobacterium wangiae TaxID=2902623 RepID=UPI001E3C5D16|nr:GNAT family protein [Halobacterium wangiae]